MALGCSGGMLMRVLRTSTRQNPPQLVREYASWKESPNSCTATSLPQHETNVQGLGSQASEDPKNVVPVGQRSGLKSLQVVACTWPSAESRRGARREPVCTMGCDGHRVLAGSPQRREDDKRTYISSVHASPL